MLLEISSLSCCKSRLKKYGYRINFKKQTELYFCKHWCWLCNLSIQTNMNRRLHLTLQHTPYFGLWTPKCFILKNRIVWFRFFFLTVKVSEQDPVTVSFIVKSEQPAFIIAEQFSRTFTENRAEEFLLNKSISLNPMKNVCACLPQFCWATCSICNVVSKRRFEGISIFLKCSFLPQLALHCF